jgi:hypothetical protein
VLQITGFAAIKQATGIFEPGHYCKLNSRIAVKENQNLTALRLATSGYCNRLNRQNKISKYDKKRTAYTVTALFCRIKKVI